MDVQRLHLPKDVCNGQESFVNWLEKQEASLVGVEDGVFVAEVDPQLCLNQQNKEDFVGTCAKSYLDQVDLLRVRKFTESRIYFSAAQTLDSEVDKKAFRKFKADCCSIKNFEDDTCCTHILKEEGLEKLFHHFEECICGLAMKTPTPIDQSLSKVVVEELGVKMRKKFENWSETLNKFDWKKPKQEKLAVCDENECMLIQQDTVESDKLVGCSEDNIVYGFGISQKRTPLKITSNFCLSRIFNIIWLVPEGLPGLHYSYIYFGTPHAFFPVHVEDALLLSVNFLHIGHPKLWIVIPPWATALLDYHLARSGTFLTHTKCRNLLGHKCLLPTVHWLKKKRIPFKIVVQRPGDMIILYPSAAHFGFNLGHNVAEAINIGTKSWIPWGINAMKCTCFPDFNIHLKLGPLVAAFRPDLLTHVLTGQPVMTPQMVRGVKLLFEELSKFVTVEECNSKATSLPETETMLKCPAKTCTMTFNRTDDCKNKMMKHVKRSHTPLQTKLVTKMEEMFS